MRAQPLLLAGLSLCCSAHLLAQGTPAPSGPLDDSIGRQLAAVPGELYLADSSLRIINVYKAEASTLRELRSQGSAAIVEALVRRVYQPYASFWQGYLGDETRFREWAAASLLARDHPIHSRLPGLLNLKLDSLFTASTAWLVRTTGRRPRGTWYIVFGPGWTDMGGLTDGTMVADFTKMDPDPRSLEFKFPHELIHMVQGASNAPGMDPDTGTVLSRMISEGLACYGTYAYAAGRLTPAQSVGYTGAEWAWALTHERELVVAARPYLRSKARADLDRFAARNQQLVDSGPTAAGYFLGFRIIQGYVARHGLTSWTGVIGLRAQEVLSRSGYKF
jgi:predicted Zn-dependent protease DUF2268